MLKRSYNTESRSAGAFIPQETHPQDPDQQGSLFQKNLILKVPYLNQEKPLFQRKSIHELSYNTEPRAAGPFILAEPDQHDVI